ncbi:MAG: Gfo/Idh/MocA family oxidoreductase [Candidatus Harrisonbacteria bacterium]|nr:Gfo/Idh/MocA family oxidoreductase [Candidatus Harrisonbacteria bacterium]
MQKIVRLGFVGCGKHATRGHAYNALALPDIFSITAAYDTNREALSKFCSISSTIRAMGSADEVIKSFDVDAVVIATPHEFHLDLMHKAVKAKKHTLCEKPLWVGDHTKEVSGILDSAQQKGLVFTSCHLRRFAAEFMRLHDLIPELKFLDALLEFNFRFFYHEPSTVWKKAEAESLLLDHLNHEVDILHYLLGYAPLKLEKRADSFDHYEVVGERADGIHIFFLGTRRLKSRIFRNELELVFEKGRVVTLATLENGIVHSTIITTNFDQREESVIQLPHYSYEDVLVEVMRNFGETILGRATNYLGTEDLITNNESCNELLSRGVYSYTPTR